MYLKNKKIRAFSIAEVIVAIMVFSIGILSVIQVFPLNKKLSRLSEKATVAKFLAQEKVEEMFALTYQEIPVGAFETKAPVDASGDFSKYQRQTVVEYIDGNYQVVGNDQNLKKITSTVYWQEGNHEKSENIITVIFSR